MPPGIRQTPSAAALTPEALEQAFPHLRPSQRLAMVERAVAVEAASRRRRQRLARARRSKRWPWIAVLIAGLLCLGTGLWNYYAGEQMLQRLATEFDGDTPSWSWEQLPTALRYFWEHKGSSPPSPWIPVEGPHRALLIAQHRERYLAYQTLGAVLAALGGAVLTGSSVMMVFQRR